MTSLVHSIKRFVAGDALSMEGKAIAHRNFRCIVVMVTPKEELPRLENIVETYCKAHRENASRIEIKCMAEESL